MRKIHFGNIDMFEILFHKNPIPMWIYDLKTLLFLEVNESAQIHYGYSREEFLSMTIKDIRPTEEVPVLLKHLETMVPGYENAGYWKHIKKNGDLIFVEIISQVISYKGYDAELILSLDQTERFKALDDLKKNESKLNSILQSLNDIVWSSDPDNGTILFINENVIDLYGYSSSEFYKNPNLWQECIHPEDKDFVIKSFSDIKNTGKFSAEYRIISKDKSIHYVRDQAKIIWDNFTKRILRIDGILRDITKEKEYIDNIKSLTDNLKKQNEQLKELAFINSHKMRGPLTSITGALEILDNWDINKEVLSMIRDSAYKLDDIIKETAGKLSLQLNEKDFSKSSPKKIELIVHIDDDPLQLLINKRTIHGYSHSIELISFSSGKEALEFLEEELPDLILLDINMPVMNGWEFLEELIKRNIVLDVYVLSSSIDPEDRIKSQGYENVKGYISKPMTRETLIEILG